MNNTKSTRSNTGYKDITLRKRTGRKDKFETRLTIKTKSTKNEQVFIGNFDDLETAKTERINFIKQLF